MVLSSCLVEPAYLPTRCMVVAGDKKGPTQLWSELREHAEASRAVFLNDEDQVTVGGDFAVRRSSC